ncbi:MAG: hypothetical protein EOO13_04655 [Chitinophagaceae bacterium]|nr:MAG: hypothetical protein EOO13_04655 [Chitinophagaceae bacterium]
MGIQFQKVKNRLYWFRPMVVMSIMLALVLLMGFGMEDTTETETIKFSQDSVASRAAFKQVYAVLMSPRCMNCHPSGDTPLQGEDSHLHTFMPKRGLEGKGVAAMKCVNCHQSVNTPGLKMPPGNPEWHLPPANMKMVFQGRTPRELAKQLIDLKQNGNKNIAQLIAHADDGLVKAGWNPGEGRKLPPISHAAFKKAWVTWLSTGAFAPTGDK